MNMQPLIYLALLTIISSIVLTGCASAPSQPKLQNDVIVESGVTAIETSEGSDTTFIHKAGSGDIICASRGNDYAFVQSAGGSLSLSDGTDSAGIGGNSSASVAELGGINSGVLLSREVMYRTCEFMGNLRAIDALTPEMAKGLFDEAIQAVLKISTDYESSAETGQATSTVSSSAPNEN